jgi:DNA-binding PadR family transcriptional regulator
MQEVEVRTDGALELGPGTLYRSIKQLLERGMIIEVEPEPGEDAASGNRRRLYSLTPAGEARTAEEARRLRDLVRWAEDAMVLEGGRA